MKQKWIDGRRGGGRQSVPLEIRFYKFFTKGAPEECWLWRGANTGSSAGGHGRIRADAPTQGCLAAHRVAYELHHGVKLPPTAFVLHRCDVGNCVNPAHLFLGTQADNIHDMDNKRRRKFSLGEANGGGGKLSEEDVRYIRRERAKGRKIKELGDMFGVSDTLISHIFNRRNWKHI